jgi:hypothetical protein
MLLDVNYGIAELNVILLNSTPKRRKQFKGTWRRISVGFGK